MKNKIVEIICFICFTILFSLNQNAFSLENYPIDTNSAEIQQLKTRDIETLFRTELEKYDKITRYLTVPRGLILSIDSSVFFQPQSCEIIEDSKDLLDKIGETIKEIDTPCIVEGNAKIENSSLDYDTSWENSTTQAQKISDYLIENHNIHPDKIRAIGFGASNPAKLVQRIDFVILNYDN
ncbi:MAG: OmpA family protein [Muribaculaceae bacterium]|nr:OmpA family protein [Muribaculaceae bacterium]